MRTSRCFRVSGALAILVGLASISSVAVAAPQAQTNLLTNPDFEDGWYSWNNLGEVSVPNGWDFWYATEATPQLEPQDSPWGRPEVVTWFFPAGFAETWFWRDGEHTLKVFGAWRPIWFRLGQTVNDLTLGAEYKFVAPVFPETVAEYISGGVRGRSFSDDPLAGEFLLRARTGNQTLSSGWVNQTVVPPWEWTLLSLNFVAQSDTAVVEVEVRGRWGLVNNAFFLDGLSLGPTGATTAVDTPQPETGGGGEGSGDEPAEVGPTADPLFGPTSTPQANGEVWYTVRGNDTLAVIAFYHNTTADAIQELNQLGNNLIFPGQNLLIRVVEPPSTEVPAEEPTTVPENIEPVGEEAIVPTPTVETVAEGIAETVPEYGEICVLAYDDLNGNAANDNEAIASGAHIILVNADGPLDSRTSGRSDELDCFRRLAPSLYRITVLPPNGYHLTTADSAEINLERGAIITLAFGMDASGQTVIPQTTDRTSTLYALAAGVLLLIVAGFVGLRLVAARRR